MLTKFLWMKKNYSDYLFALWWYIQSFWKANDEELKSFNIKDRTPLECGHRSDRITDDVAVVKKMKFVGQRALRQFLKRDSVFNNYKCTNSYLVSFVIPYGNGNSERFPLLKASITRLQQLFPNSETLISNMSGDLADKELQELKAIKKNIVILSEKYCDPKDFNIALSVNIGVMTAKKPIICILQADIILPLEAKLIIDKFVDSQYDYWFPAIGVFFADNDSTNLFIHRAAIWKDNNSFLVLSPGSYVRELESYYCLIRKQAFIDIGGFYSEFTQPAEDNDFYDRLVVLKPFPRRETHLIHLYHPPFWKQNSDAWLRNKDLLKNMRSKTMEERIALSKIALENCGFQ